MDAVPVGQVTVDAERHVSQVVQEIGVGVLGELVERRPELLVGSAVQVEGDSVALPGAGSPGCARPGLV